MDCIIELLENRPIQNGEFDLVNISLLGIDPVTGRSFDECNQEWKEALARVIAFMSTVKWWQFRKRLQAARQLAILAERQGFR